MTLQNRVTPDAKIVSENWRGTFMGNRGGRIHNPKTKTLLRRQWASKRWICCVLEFKNRQREVMGKSYTELFFLDEVTALTAGHRPCFECRRKEANRFTEIWQTVFGNINGSRADAMDKVLHEQRLAPKKKIVFSEANTLPDGVMIKSGDDIYTQKTGSWLKWSGLGYTKEIPDSSELEILTSNAMIEILRHGYEPNWHGSAT